MDAYIVIGVMILMIVAFVMNKWPFGLITMSCCIILGVTGVLDASGTFAGFCNPFVVMLAGSFVVTNALAKTSFISNVQKRIIQLQNGKSGFRLMAIFVIAIIVLSTFMPGPAMLAIIIVMARNLSDAGEVNAARIIFPAAALTTLWNGRIPFGIGAGNFAILNGFLEPYGDQYVVGMFDPMKAGLIPGILLALYTIFCYKLLPHKSVDRSVENEAAAAGVAEVKMSKRDEIITYITFCMMLAFMVLNQFTGDLLYIWTGFVCSIPCIYEDYYSGRCKTRYHGRFDLYACGYLYINDCIVGDGSRATDRRVDLVSVWRSIHSIRTDRSVWRYYDCDHQLYE